MWMSKAVSDEANWLLNVLYIMLLVKPKPSLKPLVDTCIQPSV